MPRQTTSKNSSNTYALVAIGILFFIFGFVTWINGTLIPFLKIICELESDTQAFLVVTASYMAYFFLALPSAAILKRIGYKNGLSLGLLVMVAGTLIFIPAAKERSFALFLTGLFLQGGGLALLQTASNPYISILGPIESAAKRISMMGISNKVAGALSPLILSSILLGNINATQEKIAANLSPESKELLLSELANRIITPYIIMALVLLLLAFFLYKSALPEIKEEIIESTDIEEKKNNIFISPFMAWCTMHLSIRRG
ncbi:MFS transporter [Phnomibacter ginsenosidimutans]|uniref:MFS transporter n=1 Tax=Phnomibacter ginsenosidimutans TaxID=2676868 RepID=UPI001FE38BBB|nr:MFS transporter [Phnomibacter ginsenosidimutans]